MEERVKSIKEGNLHVFEDLIHDYQQQIYCYILTMTRNPEDSKDLTQEVFMTAYSKIDQYNKDVSMMAWLYKIAKNKTLNQLKRERLRAKLLFNQTELTFDESYFKENYDFNIEIEKSLDKLSIDDKNLLILKGVEELSYNELEIILNTTKATIRKRYERARKKFVKYYESECEVNNYA